MYHNARDTALCRLQIVAARQVSLVRAFNQTRARDRLQRRQGYLRRDKLAQAHFCQGLLYDDEGFSTIEQIPRYDLTQPDVYGILTCNFSY